MYFLFINTIISALNIFIIVYAYSLDFFPKTWRKKINQDTLVGLALIFFTMTTILSAIMAVGAIEDCKGHCLGNENWTLFFIMVGIMMISAFLTFATMKGNQ